MRSIGPFWPDVGDSEIKALLHPASAFGHPQDVVNDPDLTRDEKRAILASWASDACAVDSRPALRLPPGAKRPVAFDEVVDALRSLDEQPRPKWKRVLRARRSDRGENQDGGIPLS
jgi:hypothetical protein